MSLTPQQQQVVDYLKGAPSDTTVKINAIAGSGKTHTLVAISKTLNPTNGLYLAYNKSIATEAAQKFPRSVECKTTHSLAYGNTVRPLKLKVGFFSYKSITEKISYDSKLELIELIREFCLSEYVDFHDFSAELQLTPFMESLCLKYLDLMGSGKIECTHDFYLKLFHILLATNEIEMEPLDLLLTDECGDLNMVTLEITKLLPAKVKIFVGDERQNIYGFNHTVNVFEHLKEGTSFSLTQSFRVDESIAKRIQTFGKRYLSPSFEFKGIKHIDKTIHDRCVIARTNASLIDYMIELNANSTPYSLVRSAADIFKLPLIVCSFAYQGKIYAPEYKHLQSDIDEWYENPSLHSDHKTVFSYLSTAHSHDMPLVNAIKLVGKHGKSTVIEASKIAKSHEKVSCNLTLASAHSVKGLEFSEVELMDDMNRSIETVIENLRSDPNYPITQEDKESLNLYYVASSRSKVSLLNAIYL